MVNPSCQCRIKPKAAKDQCIVNIEVTVNNSQSPGEHSPRINESASGPVSVNVTNLCCK